MVFISILYTKLMACKKVIFYRIIESDCLTSSSGKLCTEFMYNLIKLNLLTIVLTVFYIHMCLYNHTPRVLYNSIFLYSGLSIFLYSGIYMFQQKYASQLVFTREKGGLNYTMELNGEVFVQMSE